MTIKTNKARTEERRKLRLFGHIKRMINWRLLAKALATLASSTRNQGDRENVGRQFQRGYRKEEAIYSGSEMCERQEAAEDICSRSLVLINQRLKTEELYYSS